MLRDIKDRTTWYVAVLVFITRPDDPQPIIAEANWYGQIVDTPSGANGFGYDPHFFLPNEQCTVADLNPDKKNLLSHRGQAMQKLLRELRERGLATQNTVTV